MIIFPGFIGSIAAISKFFSPWNNESILYGSLATGSADSFGSSIAINSTSNRIVVGAPGDEAVGEITSTGLAYVFISGSSGWTQEAILSGSLATGSGDFFGLSVAMNSAGDCIVVGARLDEAVGGITSTGLAYVFVSGSSGWIQQAILSGSLATGSSDYFGNPVKINSQGNIIVVGAIQDEAVGNIDSTGLAYIFVSGSSGWIQQAILSGSLATGSGEQFGQSVAMNSEGNIVVIGVPLDERQGQSTGQNEGLAYIFVSGSSGWTEQAILSGSLATGSGEQFGQSVAMNSEGNIVVIGVPLDERQGQSTGQNEGLVYVFISGSSGWIQQAILSGSLATGSSDFFGNFVEINSEGNIIVVGAPGDEAVGGIDGSGLVYVFVSDGNNWIQNSILSGSLATGSSDGFGSGLTINANGSKIIISAPSDEFLNVDNNLNSGLVYVYNSNIEKIINNFTYSIDTASLNFGNLGTASFASSSLTSSLTVPPGYLYSPMNDIVTLSIISSSISGAYSVQPTQIRITPAFGGINTNITATYSPNASGQATSLIRLSSSVGINFISLTGSVKIERWIETKILSGSLATGSFDYFGQSVAMNSAGDRIIVGANADEAVGGIDGSGLVYVFISGSSGWIQQAILSGSLATGSLDYFGYSVAMNSAGDRIIVGAYQDERQAQSSTRDEGLVYVFISGSSGWIQQSILSGSLATGSNDSFGYSVAMNSAGDRIIVGAYQDEAVGGITSTGLAYIFVSGSSGWIQQAILSGSLATGSSDFFGNFVEINSEGNIIVVGARGDEAVGGITSTGLAYIFVSGSSGWTEQAILSGSLATGSSDTFGSSIAMNSAGDRIIVGAYQDERISGLTNEGVAYIFSSGSNGWREESILFNKTTTGANRFGWNVKINSIGDKVAVSQTFGTTTQGVYVFVSSSNGWIDYQKITGSLATGSSDYLINAQIAMNSTGERIVVGIPNDEAFSGIDSTGLAYINDLRTL